MTQERGQFTFYASFAVALGRIRKRTDRCAAYDAIVQYALYGNEPDMEKLPDPAAIAFDLIRPNLDASRRKAMGGKGGRVCQDIGKIAGSSWEDTGNKKEIEKETETEIEDEIENEYEYPASSSKALLRPR